MLRPQVSEWRPRRRRVMQKPADIVAADTTGEWDMGKYTAVERCRHTMRLPNLPTVCTNHVAGRKATTSKIGCALNKNSCGTTRNCDVPNNTYDALKWRHSNERLNYDVHWRWHVSCPACW